MDHVRIGIVGYGNMGSGHADYLTKGEVLGAVLAAVCDTSPERLRTAGEKLGETVKLYDRPEAMFSSGEVDAVLICTPHYDHPELAVQAFGQGLHVLIEKPAGVYTKRVREMNETASASGKVFGIMYNQRTNPLYQKMRDLIQSGELGKIKRFNWIITDWYRSQSYYDSGTWRATWEGEGGGVLINQCPHNLDLLLWTIGMVPARVRAFCHFGKHRNIEVEDDVTAYIEMENGATGVFITSVADAPGTNRFEVTGERGKLLAEDGGLTFWRLRTPEPEFNREYQGGFGMPEYWKCDIPASGANPQHKGITQNFVHAVRNGTPLLAPGEEGIRGLALSNAMHLSSWTDDWVNYPPDEQLYEAKLHERIERSVSRKKEASDRVLDTRGTY